jgi:hypothetical protein
MLSGVALLGTGPKVDAQSNAKEEGRLDNSALVVKEVTSFRFRFPDTGSWEKSNGGNGWRILGTGIASPLPLVFGFTL